MIIVDASVGFKWLFKVNEDYLSQASKILGRHLNGESKLLVPELFLYEISNTLINKTSIPSSNAVKLIDKLLSFNLEIVHPSGENLKSATDFAKKYNTSVYDMLYAVIAKENKATLVTADEKFIQKTGFKFVKHIKDY